VGAEVSHLSPNQSGGNFFFFEVYIYVFSPQGGARGYETEKWGNVHPTIDYDADHVALQLQCIPYVPRVSFSTTQK